MWKSKHEREGDVEKGHKDYKSTSLLVLLEHAGVQPRSGVDLRPSPDFAKLTPSEGE